MKQKIRDIRLSGLSTSPNDLDCDDGNLAVAIGVLHEDGAMKGACHSAPKSVKNMYRDDVIYQHETPDGKKLFIGKRNYDYESAIGTHNPTYFWFDLESGDGDDLPDLFGKDVKSVVSVGNTLKVFGSEDGYHFLWDGIEYKSLGNHIPELGVTFGLHDVLRKGEHGYPYFSNLVVDGKIKLPNLELTNDGDNPVDCVFANDENIRLISDTIFGIVNKRLSQASEDNLFAQPFLIRATLVLYDETETMSTPPMLLIPNSGAPAISAIVESFEQISDTLGNRYVFNQLEINTLNVWKAAFPVVYGDDNIAQRFSQWKDIVKGVRVYVSQPLYSYDQSGEIKALVKGSEMQNYPDGTDVYEDSRSYLKFPTYGEDEYVRSIAKCSALFLYREYGLDEFLNIVTSEPMNKETEIGCRYNVTHTHRIMSDGVGALNSIATHKPFVDDYFSHDDVVAENSLSYNNRVSIFSTRRHMYNDFNANQFIGNVRGISGGKRVVMVVVVNNLGETIYVKSKEMLLAGESFVPYVFFPATNVREIRLYDVAANKYMVLTCHEHEGFNGSISFETFKKTFSFDNDGSLNDLDFSNNHIVENNSVYTSEVNNPFVFRAANVEQIGNGRIIAMAPASQALSSGQFGQFPMYCFTTEGVWALEVSDTGGWKSKQPISRDVAKSKNMILQLDQSVLFATDRGLMVISGSTVECITEVFDGDSDVFVRCYKEYLDAAMSRYANIDMDVEHAPTFKEYIAGESASMHYDYTHQRIWVSNAEYPYSFVFGMEDKLWTCEKMTLKSAVNSYPEALANAKVGGDNVLVDLTKDGDAAIVGMPDKGFVLTRALKLGSTSLKTLTSVVATGTMHKMHVDLIVYVSNDLRTWKVGAKTKGGRMINRLGTPYRYFRVGIVSRLEKEEQLTGLSITYETREELDVL